MQTWRVLTGDCRALMAAMPEASVNCCVTSPPYWGLRDYGVEGQLGLEATPAEYVEKMVAVFSEVRRVLRDDGTLWLNLGDSYAANWSSRRDEGGGGFTDAPRQRTKYPPPGLKSKDLVGIPWRVAFALQADGWYLRSDIIWAKPNPMPESVTDRPTKSHEYVFLLSKSERYFYDADAIAEPGVTGDLRRPYGSPGANALDGRESPQGNGALRTNGKHSVADKQSAGHRIVESVARARAEGAGHDNPFGSTRNRRTVWTIPTQPYSGAHFATFPEALVEPCLLAGCPDGGTAIDPFAGSGTVGAVAVKRGRSFVGCELNPDYVALSRARIGSSAPLFSREGA